jgi:hypothetical protein
MLPALEYSIRNNALGDVTRSGSPRRPEPALVLARRAANNQEYAGYAAK